MSVLELFCDVDDYMRSFAPQLKMFQPVAGKQREREGSLCPSEVMTILIHFHQSQYRTFKAYNTEHVQVHLSGEFPHLASYQRFVALNPLMLVPLLAYLQSRYGACTGIIFIDSTSLEVCHPKRISHHRVFASDAQLGKTSMGWFYGFKLHLAFNDCGKLLACCLTPGNMGDLIASQFPSSSNGCEVSSLGIAAMSRLPWWLCSFIEFPQMFTALYCYLHVDLALG